MGKVAETAAFLRSPPDRRGVSVINRMLLDIDSRRAAAGMGASGANPDIRSVSVRPGRAVPSGFSLSLVALLIGVCVAGFVGWREWQARPTTNAIPTQVVVLPQPAKVAESSIPAPPPVEEMRGLPALPLPATASAGPEPTGMPTVDLSTPARNAARPSPETFKLSLKLSELAANLPAVRAPAAATPLAIATTPGTTTITSAPVRQVAADETVFAARAMWREGAHAGALTTLREALASAEATRNTRATSALARELARLEVADNRSQDALDLLKRLEPLLGDDADVLALRGNAEQRLAKHAEAAQSYLSALRMRPTEGKWMLGAAISLAAIGKLDEAKVWADRASARDAITPTIAAYLQQLGIAVRQ